MKFKSDSQRKAVMSKYNNSKVTSSNQRVPTAKNRYNDTREKRILISNIEDKILEVADLRDELTRSDLQGVATVKAHEIYDLLNKK